MKLELATKTQDRLRSQISNHAFNGFACQFQRCFMISWLILGVRNLGGFPCHLEFENFSKIQECDRLNRDISKTKELQEKIAGLQVGRILLTM